MIILSLYIGCRFLFLLFFYIQPIFLTFNQVVVNLGCQLKKHIVSHSVEQAIQSHVGVLVYYTTFELCSSPEMYVNFVRLYFVMK